MLLRALSVFCLLCSIPALVAAPEAESAADKNLRRKLRLMQGSNAVYSVLEAAEAGHAEVLKARLEAGANPNQKDELGNYPVHLAAAGRSARVMQLLLEAGADPQARDAKGRTPLDLCQHAKVRALLEAAHAKRVRETEVDAMVRRGDVRGVQQALKAGVNPNALSADNRGPLVMSAVDAGQVGTLRALLAAGAEVNVCYAGTDVTVLLLAAQKGSAELVGALLKAGADPMRQAGGGAYPLHNAVWFHNLEALKALLPAYEKMNFSPHCGALGFPITMALHRAGNAVVKAFVDAGINLNDKARFKDDLPLIVAAKQGRLECVKMFLAAGADKSLKDSRGKTAADYAKPPVSSLLR